MKWSFFWGKLEFIHFLNLSILTLIKRPILNHTSKFLIQINISDGNSKKSQETLNDFDLQMAQIIKYNSSNSERGKHYEIKSRS
jgi:hypothetical protein